MLAPGLLVCPACQRLVHADQLDALARTAREATAANDVVAALAAWREARDLLPWGTRQHEVVTAKVNELSKRVDAGDVGTPRQTTAAPKPHNSRAGAAAASAGGIVLLLWKFKFAAVFLLTKGKLLLLGLTKASTLFSMILSAGVYWTAFGWKLAVGLVLSIYVHEMGHVVALKRFGFKATAPMFVPGLGAFILLKQHPANPREDARIGLAGPIYGLGAALASLGLWYATGHPIFGAIAKLGAWINLFNLTPVWSLDGSRAFRAMSGQQRWLVTAAIVGALFASHEGLLWLLALVAVGRCLVAADRPAEGDRTATWQYAALLAALTAVSMVHVNVGN